MLAGSTIEPELAVAFHLLLRRDSHGCGCTRISGCPDGQLQAAVRHRRVGVGTVIEWYDFYLYAVLARVPGAACSSRRRPDRRPAVGACHVRRRLRRATVRRGRVRPHRRHHRPQVRVPAHRQDHGWRDRAGRPAAGYAQIGILAPILLVTLRLLQGLALGGEYGGAAIYVAEHAPDHKRGKYTSWIQTTATVGLFLALAVILIFRRHLGDAAFSAWGWRIPFLLSAFLVVLAPCSSGCGCRRRRSSTTQGRRARPRRAAARQPRRQRGTGGSSCWPCSA